MPRVLATGKRSKFPMVHRLIRSTLAEFTLKRPPVAPRSIGARRVRHGAVHEARLAVRLARKDREDRKEVRRLSDVDRLPSEVSAAGPDAVRLDVHRGPERAEEFDDRPVPLRSASSTSTRGAVSSHSTRSTPTASGGKAP